MVPRRPQVLADGEDVHVVGREIAENLEQFAGALAQANHYAALGRNGRIHFLGALQQPQRALVTRT